MEEHKAVKALTAKLAEAEKEIARLRDLAFNIARAAVPEWKREFERAIRLEEKLAAHDMLLEDLRP